MKNITISIILLILSVNINAQCIKVNTAFGAGEKLTYTGYYNLGMLWVAAGTVDITVDAVKYNNKDVYKFMGKGRTAKAFDWFFKLRDTLTCYADITSLKPYMVHRQTMEDKYTADHKYVIDYNNNKVYSEIQKRKRAVKKDSINLTPCSFDILSIAYHVRNINFENLTPGDKIPINMLIDGKIHQLYVRFKGYETIKTKSKKRYPCIKFSPLLVAGTMFKKGEGMNIWVSNDKNRIPIMVEAKVIIGSIKGILSSYEGLRHKSKIFEDNHKGTIKDIEE